MSLRIYDVAGRPVRVFFEKSMAAGPGQQVTWDGLDDRGIRVASGVYFYRLEAGGFTATRKMVVVK